MREFEYLEYTLRRDGGQKAQVKDRMKRAALVIGQV